MNVHYSIIFLLFLNVQGQVLETEITPYQLVDDEVLTISCTYNDERCVDQDIFVRAETGYKVLITVKSVVLNGANGDYLLIKSGYKDDDGLTGRIFTHFIRNERTYVSLSEEILLRFHVNEPKSDEYEGFVVTLEHYGEQVTTEVPTTTERSWPTPEDDDMPYLTVNMTINQDGNVTLSEFKDIIVYLASSFVIEEGFDLAEPISEENVQIEQVMRCPLYWPNSENCVQINFSLPIFLVENSSLYGTYQINSTNLIKMWENAPIFFANSKYSIYEIRNSRHVLLIWMTVICSTILLFGIVYLVSGYECSGYVLKKKKLEAERKHQSTAEERDRESVSSLSPHPLQHIPKLFDTDVTYYNPDSPVVVRNSPGRVDHEADDTLDSNTINLRNFSFNGHDDVTET
ncbi:hypothetical protein Trydic_g4053 [Trypoxylus dichotomus]